MAPRHLRRVQDADLDGKVVLVRVDHNCVRSGALTDAFRVDATISTLYNIVERGGRPILMTHVGRPFSKSDKNIKVSDDTAVTAAVRYLSQKLGIVFAVPEFAVSNDHYGITDIDTSINWLLSDLKARRIGGIYLPNARWFKGEEGYFGEDSQNRFANQLAGLADVFVNDAFGSWQVHTSTFGITKLLPSYAGLLMQKELKALNGLLTPKRPFLAVVAGAKLDTKISTIKAVSKRCDHLMLGGQLYNAYLCAKFDVHIEGVSIEDIQLAKTELLLPEIEQKLIPLNSVVESKSIDGCGCVPRDGVCGTNTNNTETTKVLHVRDLKPGNTYGYVLDVAPVSFTDARVKDAVQKSNTIFVNAVMGLTSSGFHEGTEALDQIISTNRNAYKYFGGGDTLHEFKSLSPGLYIDALSDPKYYLFTGGGTVLKALEIGAEDLSTIQALMETESRDQTVSIKSQTVATRPNPGRESPKCMLLQTCDCGPTEETEGVTA